MMGIFSGSNWNDENIKRFDALEAKLEKLSTHQNEEISLLQSKLSNKEEVINVLTDKVDKLDKRISIINVEKSSIQDELKNQSTLQKEQINLFQSKLADKEEVISFLQDKVSQLEDKNSLTSGKNSAMQAKFENQTTLQKEEINLLQNKFSEKEKLVIGLQEKVDQLEKNILIANVEKAAIEVKVENESTFQNEQVSHLKSKLSNEEEVINILQDKLNQLEERIAIISIHKANTDNQLTFLNEKTNILQSNLSDKEEVINLLNNKVDKLEEATNIVLDQTTVQNDQMSLLQSKMSNEVEAINILRDKVNQLEEKCYKAYVDNSNIYAKVEKQSTLQKEQIILLQSKLSDKENIISILKAQVDQLEERFSTNEVKNSDGICKIQDEIKRLFCLINDIGQHKDEQEKEIVELKAKSEEIIELFHNVSFFFPKIFCLLTVVLSLPLFKIFFHF